MATVGILGDNSNETAIALLRLCQEKGVSPLVGLYELTENNRATIVSIDENEIKKPKVWILQEPTKGPTSYDFLEKISGYIIVNIDKTTDWGISWSPSWDGIITYGFNGKASVTASSVTEDALQVCIQRGFKSLGGCSYEPQEFKAACPAEANPLNVLGAVAACAVCDLLS